MNFADWYTDTFDIKRNSVVVPQTPTRAATVTTVTRMELTTVAQGVYGRVYNDSKANPAMQQTAADIMQSMALACDNSVDIHPGDELTITIGGRLGQSSEVYKARAGSPHHYYEPFGAVIPGLAHQEISLQNVERL